MQVNRKLNLIGVMLLLLATLAWGTSFIVLKETISELPAFFVIAIRFLLAAGGLYLIFIKKMRGMTKKTFLCGMILGVILTLAYVTQTIGLENTTPGRNAFLTSSYCVMVPFLMWLIFKSKPRLYHVVSAFTCIVGVGLVALSNDKVTGDNMVLGNALTVVGAVFFGLQIIFIDKFQEQGHDAVRLLIPELLTAGVLHVIMSLIFELPFRGIGAYAMNLEQGLKILYLTLVCTLFAQFAQITGQKFTSASQTSIILSLEGVFGVVFSVILGDEKLTVPLVIGFAIIFIAVLISELKLDPVKLFKKKQRQLSDISKNENLKENGENL